MAGYKGGLSHSTPALLASEQTKGLNPLAIHKETQDFTAKNQKGLWCEDD